VEKDRKRALLWALLALVIAALTIWAVFARSGDLSPAEVFASLRDASPFWLGATLLCMVGFIVLEGLALLCILRHLGCRGGFFRGLHFSAADQFFSAITPSATGGQPATALIMSRRQIPGGVITTTLILNLVMYTAATLTVGIVGLAVRPEAFLCLTGLGRALVALGLAGLTVMTLLFLGLLKKGKLLYHLGVRLFWLLHRLRLMRDPEKWSRRLEHTTEEFGDCARAMGGKPGALAAVYLLDLGQRIAQITVTLTLHCAMGGSPGKTGIDLWVAQALAQIGSYCVPIPGGMGAADFLMLDGFRRLLAEEYAYELQILSRCFSFYVCTLLSGLIVLAGVLAARFAAGKEKAR